MRNRQPYADVIERAAGLWRLTFQQRGVRLIRRGRLQGIVRTVQGEALPWTSHAMRRFT